MEAGDDNNLAANKEAEPTTPKPPPLIIPGVSNISKMINHISSVIDKKEFSYKSLTDGKIRLVVNNIEAYRKTVKNLDISKISYHTYQPKQERSYRVVLKGIHYSTPIEEITNSITQLGHKVRNIYNVKSRINKQPLSMFFVDLEPNDNNKEIYAMRHLNNAIIRVEPPRQTSDIVQCHRCQEFGHTKSYCKKPYKCVKCNLMHPTEQCTKSKDSLPTCVHCLEHHTANYKGCAVYQQLLRKKPVYSNRAKENITINQQNNTHLGNEAKYTENNCNEYNNNNNSYANVVKGTVNNNEKNNENTMEKIEQLLTKQIELTNTLLNMMSLLINKICK